MSTAQIKKVNPRDFNSVADFIEADTIYQNERAKLGSGQGRVSLDPLELLGDMVKVAKDQNVKLVRLSGNRYNDGNREFTRSGIEKRFGTWTIARAFASEAVNLEIIDDNGEISSRGIAKDIYRISVENSIDILDMSRDMYFASGLFGQATIEKRFGGWVAAREQAKKMFAK